MTEAVPAVALLFDDTELGSQLREALHERGARIVHEGGVSSLSRELLAAVGADVLVVNLDDSADDALDQLYEVIDGDRPRVVFNDAQASRALVGWDRARWARHLAVKVLAAGDVDPPRPGGSRAVETPVAVAPESAAAADMAAGSPAQAAAPMAANGETSTPAVAPPPMPTPAEADTDLPADGGAEHSQQASAESENLAAELEALLASNELQGEDDDFAGAGLRFSHDEELPPLHDGNFGAPAESRDPVPADGLDEILSGRTSEPQAPVAVTAFQLDHLQLSPLLDTSLATTPVAASEPLPAAAKPAARAPDNWALLDEDDAPTAVAPEAKPDAAAFGIQKLSAADFLAPDVEQVVADIQPTMSLELVSMEEAIAPRAYEHVSEMLLDDSATALSRLVLLGAAAGGTESVCQFLGALPAAMRLTFLHTQHLGDRSEQALLQQLTEISSLPVRLAEQNGRARVGEVLVVPAGHQARVRRDGSIELQADSADALQSPSIDASFTMAAGAFGRDALAIVFAGRGTDAVAGSQAIHDRGGQVWVESSSGEHFADMVSGIYAERLVSFSGTPSELAAHLIEVFP